MFIPIVLFLLTSASCVQVSQGAKSECNCLCSSHTDGTVCDYLDENRLRIDANTFELKQWSKFFPFVKTLKDKWREEVISIVEAEMKKYISKEAFLPKPEFLVVKPDDEMLNDSEVVTESSKNEGGLAKNVSDLLAKVEMVENRTMEVEEELKSERRVRRHLEQEVKEAQSSLISLGDQLQNVTTPVDEILNHVQMVMFASLEDLNKTIHEEHLQKLYYKVDGVVYQNETKKLDERLEHVETELHDGSNESVVAKLTEDVKNLEENLVMLNTTIGNELEPRMATLETETVKRDKAEDLEQMMINILNNTELFKKGLSDVWSNVQDFKKFQQKIQNFSEEWAETLKSLQFQIEDLKNKTFEELGENDISDPTEKNDDNGNDDDNNDIITSKVVQNKTKETEEDATDWEYVSLVDEEPPSIADRIRIAGGLVSDNTTCTLPDIKDPHLLADLAEHSDGRQALTFGCRPIGHYVVNHSPIPVRCEQGTWKGPFSSCHQLPDEASIDLLANLLKKDHPCISGLGELPDPTNCTRFFKCAHGKVTIHHCGDGLHFNPKLRVCDYPIVAGCIPTETGLIKELKDTVPPVLIEPNTVDKQNGLMGTGPSGQLIVHPRSSFTLHCLYPENIWGSPTWNVIYSYPEAASSGPVILRKEQNRISLTVTAASEEDSGSYQCLTPFGKEHTVRVEVKVVHCPPILLEEEYQEVYYRPMPEGEYRVLGTTAEFQCEDGHKVVAVCMADGYWSRGVPNEEECTLKKRSMGIWWNCKPLDTSRHPHLIVERNNVEKIITFKCAGRLRLLGTSFTRCRDDGFWSHMSLPRCVS